MEEFSLASPISDIPLEEIDNENPVEDRDEVIFTDEYEDLLEVSLDRRPEDFTYNRLNGFPLEELQPQPNNDFSGNIIEGFTGRIYNENMGDEGGFEEEECLQRQMSFRCVSEGDEENILNNV